MGPQIAQASSRQEGDKEGPSAPPLCQAQSSDPDNRSQVNSFFLGHLDGTWPVTPMAQWTESPSLPKCPLCNSGHCAQLTPRGETEMPAPPPPVSYGRGNAEKGAICGSAATVPHPERNGVCLGLSPDWQDTHPPGVKWSEPVAGGIRCGPRPALQYSPTMGWNRDAPTVFAKGLERNAG